MSKLRKINITEIISRQISKQVDKISGKFYDGQSFIEM